MIFSLIHIERNFANLPLNKRNAENSDSRVPNFNDHCENDAGADIAEPLTVHGSVVHVGDELVQESIGQQRLETISLVFGVDDQLQHENVEVHDHTHEQHLHRDFLASVFDSELWLSSPLTPDPTEADQSDKQIPTNLITMTIKNANRRSTTEINTAAPICLA